MDQDELMAKIQSARCGLECGATVEEVRETLDRYTEFEKYLIIKGAQFLINHPPVIEEVVFN